MKIRNIITIFLLVFAGIFASGQVTVKGRVFDEHKDPIIGANILEKGTKTGKMTDLDGNFSITVSSSKATLVISYIGMKTQSLSIVGKTDLTVLMESNTVELEEAVVTGYGHVRKSDQTGSVSRVKVKDTETTPVVSVDQMLKGKSSGVYVNTSSSEPGGTSTVKIRGVNSLSGGTEPLYVVDGVMMDNVPSGDNPMGGQTIQQNVNPLAYLSPQDIVNIEILKDASATAIFGARGANGVVLVTTKTGSEGKTRVSYNSTLTVSTPRKKIQLLNAPDFSRYYNEYQFLIANGKPVLNVLDPNVASNNWQDQILQTSISTNNHLSITGGTKKSNYYFSMGYEGDHGILKNTGFNRGDVRFNFTNNISDKMTSVFNIAASTVNSQMTQTTGIQGAQNSTAISSMLYRNPLTIQLAGLQPEYAVTPLDWVKRYKDDNFETNINTKLSLTYSFNKTFKYEVTSSYATKYKERWKYYGKYLAGFMTGGSGETALNYTGISLDNLLHFNHNINKDNRLTGVLGVTYSNMDYHFTSYSAQGFNSDDLGYEQIGSAAIFNGMSRFRDNSSLLSFLGRATYSLKEKYLLTVSGRYDGSSKFAVGNKFTPFMSTAFAWRLGEEEFVKKIELISNMKFRLGWGQTGNQDIASGQSSLHFATEGYGYAFGSTPTIGTALSTMPNPYLRWETSEQTNAGLDFGILKDRIQLSIDVFRKTNKDMLIDLPLSESYGYSSKYVNIGVMTNEGIDITASFVLVDKKDFKWSIDGNYSTYLNKIISLGLPNKSFFLGDGIESTLGVGQPANIFMEGQPVGLFWGMKTAGIYQNQMQIDAETKKASDFAYTSAINAGSTVADATTAATNASNQWYFGRKPLAGEIIYVDKNGDGLINQAQDNQIIGNPNPQFTYGLTSNLTYKNWGLTIACNGVQGKNILNANLNRLNNLNGGIYNVSKVAYDGRWQGEGTSNYYPAINPTMIINIVSDRLIEDASYLRLSNITLSYTTKFAAKSFVKDVRFFVTGNNLLTLTKYSGFDPEVDSFAGNPLKLGIDLMSYPASKSILFGFNCNF